MKNRGVLVLIEQAIMILVLCVVAAICLTAVSEAYVTARDSHLRDRSLEDMQYAAELLQGSDGDLTKTAAVFGGEIKENTLTVPREGYTLFVETRRETYLGKAELTAMRDGEILSKITVCWQEG